MGIKDNGMGRKEVENGAEIEKEIVGGENTFTARTEEDKHSLKVNRVCRLVDIVSLPRLEEPQGHHVLAATLFLLQ